jgi:hypothetical protein
VTPPAINYQALNFWLSVSNFLILGAVGIVGWWNLRDKVTSRRFKDVEDRILLMEAEAKHTPACEYHPRLETRIDKMRAGFDEKIAAVHGDTREIKGKLDGLNRAVDLMNEYLINRPGRKE